MAACALVSGGFLSESICDPQMTTFSKITTDIDECQINGTCPEHSTCSNTLGSFVCTCNEGFMKSGSVCIGKLGDSVLNTLAEYYHALPLSLQM